MDRSDPYLNITIFILKKRNSVQQSYTLFSYAPKVITQIISL